MKDEEIIKKAVERAVENGYMLEGLDKDFRVKEYEKDIVVHSDGDWFSMSYIIFSHSFAKAFWGEEEVTGMRVVGFDEKHKWRWFEYHLMRMVLEEEPLKYIERYL